MVNESSAEEQPQYTAILTEKSRSMKDLSRGKIRITCNDHTVQKAYFMLCFYLLVESMENKKMKLFFYKKESCLS